MGRDLRISEKIKLLNQSSSDPNNEEKFFVALSEDLIDPNRERDVASKVSSILQTLKQSNLKKQTDHNLQGKDIKKATEESPQEYSVHKDVGIAGF
jgi:hypothetical protein